MRMRHLAASLALAVSIVAAGDAAAAGVTFDYTVDSGVGYAYSFGGGVN